MALVIEFAPRCAEEIITFDRNEDGTTLASGVDLGARPSYFGLTFNSGFQTLARNGKYNGNATPVTTLTPHSPPNVGSQDPNVPATIGVTTGGTFSLKQLYLGYVTQQNINPRPYVPGAMVFITGSLKGNPVSTCSYSHTFNDGIDTNVAPVLLSTPGCAFIDRIQISQSQVTYLFYVDDLQVTLY